MKKWWEVYPIGTKEGDEEVKFFCALGRYEEKYRSIEDIANESGLEITRVEDIITKYAPSGMIINDTKDPNNWGYWERIGVKKEYIDILKEEHECRLKKK